MQEDNVGITCTFARLFHYMKNRIDQPGNCARPWKSLSLEDLSKLLELTEVNAITTDGGGFKFLLEELIKKILCSVPLSMKELEDFRIFLSKPRHLQRHLPCFLVGG